MKIHHKSPFRWASDIITGVMILVALLVTPFAAVSAQVAHALGAQPSTVFKVRNIPTRIRGAVAEFCTFAEIALVAELSATVHRADGSAEALGTLSRRVVTNAGVGYIVDAFQNLVEMEALNYHDCGIGATAEAAGDTALVTPFGGARVAGTQSEPASNQYRSTATIAFTSAFAVVEHGLLSASSGGVLFDRSVFGAINVANGDSIQFQYTVTFTAGG